MLVTIMTRVIGMCVMNTPESQFVTGNMVYDTEYNVLVAVVVKETLCAK